MDYKNVYPYIPLDEDGYKKIKIKLNVNESKATLDFDETLYFDKEDHQMSLISQPGFIKGDKFYVPFNRNEDLEKCTFYVDLYNVGPDKLTLSYPIKYMGFRRFFGTCDDSDYCVIGGIRS